MCTSNQYNRPENLIFKTDSITVYCTVMHGLPNKIWQYLPHQQVLNHVMPVCLSESEAEHAEKRK